ncbi:MAG: HEAT repeat domain-containing protein [Gammaproteobacteria bacterium]
MDSIVDIILILFVIEIIATLGFISFIYAYKVYRSLTKGDKEILREDVEKILLFRSAENSALSKNDYKVLSRDALITLKVAEHLNYKNQELIQHVFLMKMRVLYNSKNMLNRYTAAKLFLYHYEKTDADKVIRLIKDPAIFISVPAARVGFKFSCAQLINEAINVFYKFRRLQKSVLSSIAENAPESSRIIVIERLLMEEDAYVKCFCYAIMMHFPPAESLSEKLTRIVKTLTTQVLPPFHIIQHLSEAIPRDLDSNVLDLKLAALKYAGHNPGYYHFVPKYLNAPEWQLRAAAAKIVGNMHDVSESDALASLLRDKEWWVRIRAAQSLVSLGRTGIQILKSQSPNIDKYAYEAANQALLDIHKDPSR